MSINLKAARARLLDAEKNLERTLREEYPVGASIRWSRSPEDKTVRIQHGVVYSHAYRDRIRVLNSRTEKCMFIYAYNIV